MVAGMFFHLCCWVHSCCVSNRVVGECPEQLVACFVL